jgi:DNA-binding PadR family transcriptional regulator
VASRSEALPRSSFLVLLALADRPRHGLGVVEEVEDRTGGEVKLGPGTLYGTLRRLEEQRLVAAVEPPQGSDDDPRRRYWAVTSAGLDALKDEALRMRALVLAAAGKQVLEEWA